MIKVAHIITRLDFGGAQGNTLYTAAHLDRTRFAVTLLTGPGGALDAKADAAVTQFVPELRREINPVYDLLAVPALYRRLKALSPDIVHTHSSKAGIVGRLAAVAAGVPVILHTFHGFGFHHGQNFLVRNFYITLEKFCARFCARLIFVSRDNMETARTLGIGRPEQYELIRSGVKLSGYPAGISREQKRAALGLPPDALVVVSLGNAKPQKNPGHFLAAAARLLPSRPGVRFIFVGGGEDLERLRAGAGTLGLADKCIFTGWRDDSAEILAAADIFAMTSLWEGLPRSLVEALKTGLPSVCYRADGVADILKDGVNGYCEQLSAVLDDRELRKRLAGGAAATDLGEFDIDLMVKRQEELCAALAGGNTGRGK